MPVGLLALALGGFGIGLTEFLIMGLLPEVARDFGVSEAAAGWLISGYALSVAIGAVPITAAVARRDRKRVLVGLMVLFVVGNLLSAVAPTYALMMTGRVVAALCHGAFFGIGAVVAAAMVPAGRQGAAIAMMFGGLTAANVLGVPFGTFLGQQWGWRSGFWAIVAVGLVALAGLVALVPDRVRRPAGAGLGLRAELAAFRRGQVWASLATTVLGYGGVFGAFTYIAYFLTGVSGFAASTVPVLLVLLGLGLMIGNYLGARAADRNLTATLVVLLVALAVTLVGFAATAESKVATVASLLLMGVLGFGLVPGLQMRTMRYAGDAPTLASGANIAAFNVGNALGAWLGGVTIAAGLGYTSPIWAGAGLTLSGLVVLTAATLAALAGSRRADAAASASASAASAGGVVRAA